MSGQQFVRLCECGCGQPTPLTKKSNPQYGHVKGQPVRFIAGHNNRLRMKPSVPCDIADCGKPAKTRGWCVMHYERWRNHGDPTTVVFVPADGCKVPDCKSKHTGRGYCQKHLTRLKRHGDLFGKHPREDELTRFWMRVDRSGACWVWKSSQSRGAYGSFRRDDGVAVGAHRHSYALRHGPIPAGLHVLHSCDNPPCVNPDHLSLGTHADNMRDMATKGRAGRFGIEGRDRNGLLAV